jgi:hypothetical protein
VLVLTENVVPGIDTSMNGCQIQLN